ncbi:retinitis pigmentosa 1-like 1 protein [Carassius gibelio]|uniref:retinitis pigmentosa 1-like 1 protein n=1 Tax=Carassius gibelio TaxID=101364 RepID=UPI00227793D5|nr:retinitis pigmentosa 1-like 1 protein [Carassius gibelio]
MASHKQSFQCFDTITDDPSLKPPFPHGHSSSASFRGSSGSTRLEPLEAHGCYLCADHQQAKAMASEATGAYSNPWYHFQTHPHSQQYTVRRPSRPEEAPGHVEDHHHHHPHRHSRKIVLVKNSDPSVRRSIVLRRRSLRSLALFMDEVSELMQCLIRKLYTLEGHKGNTSWLGVHRMSGVVPGISYPSELDSLVIADSGQRCWSSVGLEQAHPISTATGLYFP